MTRTILVFSALALGFLSLLPRAIFAGCEPDSPAVPVPQFDNDLAPGVSLWPLDPSGRIRLRPANEAAGVTRMDVSPLPPNRDSTGYQGQSAPGEFSGYELFQDVAIPCSRDENAMRSDWLVVVYGVGLQVWDLSVDPELPTLVAQKDGWPTPAGPGEWAEFPSFSEADTFVEAVEVIQDGTDLYLGIAGRYSVGFSIWTFSTTSGILEQVYQDPWNIDSRDLSMARDPNGGIYAYAADLGTAGNDGGVHVYDVLAAAGAALCVDPEGSHTCGVYVGEVADLPKVQFVSALVANGETYLAVSDGRDPGGSMKLEIWEVADPENPASTPAGASVLRFDGLGTFVSSPQLFTYDSNHYVALIENVGGIADPDQMRIHDVGNCLDSDGCALLNTAKVTETIKNSIPNFHFLDLSFSNGSPFLHYGMETTGLFGSGFERLWELGQLPATFALDTLPELTDGGGSYLDPCSGAPVDYLGDYYVNNEYGLRNFNPRHAVFTGPYLYRAANSVLDIHVWTLGSIIFSDGFESGGCESWSAGCQATFSP